MVWLFRINEKKKFTHEGNTIYFRTRSGDVAVIRFLSQCWIESTGNIFLSREDRDRRIVTFFPFIFQSCRAQKGSRSRIAGDKRFPLHWPVCYCRSLAKRPTVRLLGQNPLQLSSLTLPHPLPPAGKPAVRCPLFVLSVCDPTLLAAFASRGKCVFSVLKSEMLRSCMQLGFSPCSAPKFSRLLFVAPNYSRKLRFWKVYIFFGTLFFCTLFLFDRNRESIREGKRKKRSRILRYDWKFRLFQLFKWYFSDWRWIQLLSGVRWG